MRLRAALIALAVSTLTSGALWLGLQASLAPALRATSPCWNASGNPHACEGLCTEVWDFERTISGWAIMAAGLGTWVGYALLVALWRRDQRRLERAIERITRDEEALSPRLSMASEPSEEDPRLRLLQPELRRAFGHLVGALETRRTEGERQLQALQTSHEALGAAQAQLVAADRLATVGKLAAGVAHEVGNPLSGVLGYLSMLRLLHPASAETLELVTRVEHEVDRIDGVVRALLELGRPSRGAAEPVDVRPLVDASVKLLAATPELRGVTVRVHGPDALYLRAEPGPLTQVLVNLLLNAGQAMNGTGEIDVTLTAPDESGPGRISVVDHGPGVTPAVRDRLFEPFFTTKAPGHGTGLGLAVSRHLLSRFGGTLVLGDAPGGGAVFTVSLPSP